MKRILIILGVVVAIILGIALILPNSAHVERSIEINAPVSVIFDQVSDYKKNSNWSPWFEKDPDMEIIWGEVTEGLNASYQWSGNKDVGSGDMKTIELEENTMIKNEVNFMGRGSSMATWKFEASEDSEDLTKVTWSLDAGLAWPVERYFGLFFDGMVGPDYERGLEKLKMVCEALPVPVTYQVVQEDIYEITYLGVKDSVSLAEIGPAMDKAYDEITTVMFDNDLEVRGYPIAIYYAWNETEGYCVFEAGLPVLAGTEVKLNDRVQMKIVPAGIAAKVVHQGTYDKLNEAHFAVDQWIAENGKEMRGAPWEVYISDHNNEPDSTKWHTEIFYPIQ
ncbi:MAG: SRPBCC family protein [Vicingaceae bacterium]